jgi:membrane protease YdiL (CAAX protease family)
VVSLGFRLGDSHAALLFGSRLSTIPSRGFVEITEIESPQPTPPVAPPALAAIAPAWHTAVLVASIVVFSIHGASRFSAAHGDINRLATYSFTAAMEALLLAWVLFGLRLKKVPLRSLLGARSLSLHSIAQDLCFAVVFWIISLMVLGSLNVAWSRTESALAHRTATTNAAGQAGKAGQSLASYPSQLETLRALKQLAPANGREIAAWMLLCMMVGFTEEIVFRGYLQRQFIGWARGSVGWGVLASAVVFGSGHAYEGAHGMVLITVFGVLFSLLALYRRSLRAGIFAHAWHDLIAGLAIALLRSNHVI